MQNLSDAEIYFCDKPIRTCTSHCYKNFGEARTEKIGSSLRGGDWKVKDKQELERESK